MPWPSFAQQRSQRHPRARGLPPDSCPHTGHAQEHHQRCGLPPSWATHAAAAAASAAGPRRAASGAASPPPPSAAAGWLDTPASPSVSAGTQLTINPCSARPPLVVGCCAACPAPSGFCTGAEGGRPAGQATHMSGYYASSPPVGYLSGAESGRQVDQATPWGGYSVPPPPVVYLADAEAGRPVDQATPWGGCCAPPPPVAYRADAEAGRQLDQATPSGGYGAPPPPITDSSVAGARGQADQATRSGGLRGRPPTAPPGTEAEADRAAPGGWMPPPPPLALRPEGPLLKEQRPSGAARAGGGQERAGATAGTGEGRHDQDADCLAAAVGATQWDILSSCGFLRVEEVQVKRRRRARRATYSHATSLTMFVSGLPGGERDQWLDPLLLSVKAVVERLTSFTCDIHCRKLYVSDAARDSVVHVDVRPYRARPV
ncbi:unnamed protein product [Prorocentrum cordatum]|uniref:Uncharacterized protein n=1 Tax=Prorocentrum cordatum TaxID=2364126 RepID=A0ABN9T857_9DINO|nr:unnamed protein product [Polarella glacialis]